ncbi:MAG: hypothetical protein GQ550_07165 [Gammaproteobacteria bacterium]|nr:hypothetical protein [Gammaproteobacteria bacterium]
MKHPGCEIPDWVCWIGQDKDGTWWGYQVEPNQSHQSWYENEVGNSVRLGKGALNIDWISTLKRVK